MEKPHGSTGPADPIDTAAGVLKALADPTRLRIMWALTVQERSVGELAEMVDAHVAAVSQHLARLRAAGLVSSRRDGTRIFYRPSTAQAREFLDEVVLLTGHVTGEQAQPGDDLAAHAREVTAARAERARRAERMAAGPGLAHS
ncbi:ArsR/SmtB family transcription factor [Actinocatenispora rupis]|uniref:HTH arsR-type domain-containing protein n=1 Tax=Actinocatenispora rupis TaxID=519421 RepID=A0A8J3J999_9ACTN|nr:metalloregulator ArsR/SmtB family transcription factor [Actinocatenispora rupis]GID14237.1 hypothetical protein Aru02nite_51260 [Actinocatenispora rupis]